MTLPTDEEWIDVPARPTPGEEAIRHHRVDRLALAGVWLWSFAIHAGYALTAAPNLLPISDANGYRHLGEHLAEGFGYVRPYDLLNGAVRPTAEFPPGFPALIAVFELLGIDGVAGQRVALASVTALGAVGVVLVARRLFSPPAAVVLGLVVGAHPALFQPTAAMLAESLYAVVVVAVLLAAVRLFEVPTPARAFALGLLGGAATLTRSEGVLLAALLALPTLAVLRRRQEMPRIAGALLVGLILLPGTWAVRNITTFERPVLVSNNLGSVLAGANCDTTYHGDLVGFWVIDDECFTGFRDEDLARGDESVVASELQRKGLSYLRENLDDLPRVATVRVLRTFQLWEPEQQARLATFEGRRLLTERLTGWIAWITYAAAVVGIADLARRRRWAQLWFLVAPVALVVVVSATTYGNPRFRITADVVLLLLAAVGIRTVARRLRGRFPVSPAPPAVDDEHPTT